MGVKLPLEHGYYFPGCRNSSLTNRLFLLLVSRPRDYVYILNGGEIPLCFIYCLVGELIKPIVKNGLTRKQGTAINMVPKILRNVLKRFNGVIKAVFKCTFRERTLHYNPKKAAKMEFFLTFVLIEKKM